MNSADVINDIHTSALHTVPFSHFGVRLAAETKAGKPDPSITRFGGDCHFQAAAVRELVRNALPDSQTRILTSSPHVLLEVEVEGHYFYPEITYATQRAGQLPIDDDLISDTVENVPNGSRYTHTEFSRMSRLVRVGPPRQQMVYRERGDLVDEYPYDADLDANRKTFAMQLVEKTRGEIVGIAWSNGQWTAFNKSRNERYSKQEQPLQYANVHQNIARQCGSTTRQLTDYLEAAMQTNDSGSTEAILQH